MALPLSHQCGQAIVPPFLLSGPKPIGLPAGRHPCTGIRRYKRKGRERFLTERQLLRLGTVLDSNEVRRPHDVGFIRLLLHIGCRKSEIMTLVRPDYPEGRLFLSDGKTGSSAVLLNSRTQEIVEPRVAEGSSPWVFPSVSPKSIPRRSC